MSCEIKNKYPEESGVSFFSTAFIIDRLPYIRFWGSGFVGFSGFIGFVISGVELLWSVNVIAC